MATNSNILAWEIPRTEEPGGSQSSCCCCQVASVVSDPVQPHRQQPTRLSRPWDSPGENTGVGHSPWSHKSVRLDLATKQQEQ